MPVTSIPYKETSYFSRLITDYLQEKDSLKSFYHRFPKLENFGEQIDEKKQEFSKESREVLVKVLKEQYEILETSENVQNNIELLKENNTYTVTTGHQLNLFTGPLYFLYKIVSAINLTKHLKSRYPEHNFVPVYWMATEDHDLEEINYFNLNGKKFKWNTSQTGAHTNAVGKLSTEGIQDVYDLFSAEIGGSRNAEELNELFSNSYLKHQNLTDATFYLANQLFQEYGLVILDADNPQLKKEFVPLMTKEISEQISNKSSQKAVEKLAELDYGVQVNPREINLFYLHENKRERLIEREGKYFVNETEKVFSAQEILRELQEHPERFSPNVMMRPLYEEVILPNLCYIGGGGELAYWLELKDLFAEAKITFPILLLRNSALIESHKIHEKRQKLEVSDAELFLKQHELINRKVRKISNIDIDFSPQKEHLVKQFQEMYDIAEKTDPSFLGAVKAQEVKQLKGLENLEKRLLRAQRRKLKDEVSRIANLQNELFPNKSLQERQTNFSEVYAEYGKELIPFLIENLNPLDQEFKILTFGEK